MECKHKDCYHRVLITGTGGTDEQTACYYAVIEGRSRMSQGIDAANCTVYKPRPKGYRHRAQLGKDYI